MNPVLICVPITFLVLSFMLSVRSVKHGKSRRTVVIVQAVSFLAICAAAVAVPFSAVAATTGAAPAAAAADSSKGMSMIASALAEGMASIGAGIAVATSAPAAIGATGEDPKIFGKAMIFVVLGEGIAIYGLLIAMMILNKAA